jgi:hypothetical protein
MEDLDNVMHYAVGLEFNAPKNPEEPAVMAISFGSPEYSSRAYFLYKENFKGKKLTLALEVNSITLNAIFRDEEGETMFTTVLNYDKTYFKEFVKTWPPGGPVALTFGVNRQCEFYIINPEKKQSNFSVFVLKTYEITNVFL